MVHTMLLASNYIPVRSLDLQQSSIFPTQEGIHCDVVFGSPSSDCRGTGICKISGTNSLLILHQKKACKRTQAVMVERADKQGISLIFFRSLLCSQLYRHHFWKGVLTMKEACILPQEIRDNLQIEFSQMLPGNYQVREESGYFRVDIDCIL